jgi:hypothetical protein
MCVNTDKFDPRRTKLRTEAELPMSLNPKQLALPPKRACEITLNVLPMRIIERTDRQLCVTCKKSKVETALPMRLNPRTEMVLPDRRNDRNERLDPKLMVSKIETAEPSLPNPRSERLEPNWTKSRTLTAESL